MSLSPSRRAELELDGADNLPIPPRPPRRAELDLVHLEGLADVIDTDGPDRALLFTRAYPELEGGPLKLRDIEVVLYDMYSLDSFAACYAARRYLGSKATYVGVNRGMTTFNLDKYEVDFLEKGVVMLGVTWTPENLRDLAIDCLHLIILDSHTSAQRDMEQLGEMNCTRIFAAGAGVGVLAWNMFQNPEDPKPPPALFRALEDMETGRRALRNVDAMEDGLEAAMQAFLEGKLEGLKTPFQEVQGFPVPTGPISHSSPIFSLFEELTIEGGRPLMRQAIEVGRQLHPGIQRTCKALATRKVVRTLVHFPHLRCALLNANTVYPGRVAEALVAQLVVELGEGAKERVFGAVFEVRGSFIRVHLRSPRGGADVAKIAGMHMGTGHAQRAFFVVPISTWDRMWAPTEVVLWDVESKGGHLLQLRRGDEVMVARRQGRQRFRDMPFDEWSWGFNCADPTLEGWLPTLSHTLFVATKNVPIAGTGVSGLSEGDLVVARGEAGAYLYGWVLEEALPRAGNGGSSLWKELSRVQAQPGRWFPKEYQGSRVLVPIQPEWTYSLLGGSPSPGAAAAAAT